MQLFQTPGQYCMPEFSEMVDIPDIASDFDIFRIFETITFVYRLPPYPWLCAWVGSTSERYSSCSSQIISQRATVQDAPNIFR